MSGDAGLAVVPERGVAGWSLHTLASAAIVLTILVVLWPPTDVYWLVLLPLLGETATLALVAVLAVGLGTWFGRTTGFGVGTVAVGSALAYGAGMVGIEVWMAPDGLAYLAWYGVLTACVLGGALGWAAIEWSRAGA